MIARGHKTRPAQKRRKKIGSSVAHSTPHPPHPPNMWYPVSGGGGGRDALEGGRYLPSFQGALPMPSHCLTDAKCPLQWHL